jgi:ligand-binding sensor domain-containing protein
MRHKVKNIFTKGTVAILFISTQFLTALAQNYTVKTFTTDNGLPHNNIRVIAEDSTGFLWIGTWDGLSRYDGHEFKNYYHIPGDTNSISFFSIRNLIVDRTNNLWILTGRGDIVLYDRIRDDFHRITSFGENSKIQINNLNVDKNDDLWMVYKDGIIKRDIISGDFIHYKIINEKGESCSLNDQDFFGIGFSGNGNIWLCGRMIYEFEILNPDQVNGKAVIKKIYNIESSFLEGRTDFDYRPRFSFYESPSGNCWIFSNIGLFKLNKEKGSFYEYSGEPDLDEFVVSKIFDWAWYKVGLYSYNPLTHYTRFIKPEISQLISAIHQQGKKMIWFSNTSESGTPLGLTQIVFSDSFFKNYMTENEGHELQAVYSITKDQNNNLWVGIRGKDHIVQITPDNKNKKTGQLTPELFKLSGHIRSMIKVKEGIWIGYYNDLLLFYDFKSGRFIRHFADGKTFRSLAVSKKGSLYIGRENLSLYYPESGKTELLWKSSRIINKIYLNEKVTLWAGISTIMLLKYNTINKESVLYSLSDGEYNIEDICTDEENNLWVATQGEGVCKFNPESGKTVFYTTADGLSNNTTYSILKDRSGYFWISTDNGISRLNPKTGNIRMFNKTDGLSITEFNSRASYIADDGEFFFGGMGGFAGFYPDSLSGKDDDFDEPKILLTDFKVSGEKRVLPKPLNVSDTIVLLKGENNFQISFSSTDFTNSSKTLYRYRLNNINLNWIETDLHNRSVNYSNIRPGRYLFEIQATNRNGEWTADKKITFIVTPFFFQTNLFKISFPLLIVFVLGGIIIVYIRQIKQKESQKQDAMKLQSLQGQMNPHFVFNSLNSINYFISNNDALSANRYIADFSRLIRSILSNLGSNYVLFENEANSIRDYLNIEHLRFGDKFDYEFNTKYIPDSSGFEVFPGLVQPFIENAIWHGVRGLEKRKGFIRVTFSSLNQDRIVCTVEDDGIGRKASFGITKKTENHNSRGIGLALERLQLISKIQGSSFNLKITDLYPYRKDTGTRVEIDIPAKQI